MRETVRAAMAVGAVSEVAAGAVKVDHWQCFPVWAGPHTHR